MPHEQERPGNQEPEVYRKQGSFAMDCVDDRSSWSLHRDPNQPTESQHIAHTAGTPSTRSKVGSQEWAQTGLHVGEKEVEPFERSHTPRFSWCRIAHRASSRGFLKHVSPTLIAGFSTNFCNALMKNGHLLFTFRSLDYCASAIRNRRSCTWLLISSQSPLGHIGLRLPRAPDHSEREKQREAMIRDLKRSRPYSRARVGDSANARTGLSRSQPILPTSPLA